MKINRILLLEKDIEDQSKFIEALRQIDSTIICITSTDYSDALLKQNWKAVFISVDDFIGKGALHIQRLAYAGKPAIIAIADSTIHKQACAETGMDYFLIKPNSVSGWMDLLEQLFSSVLQFSDVLSPWI
ncbi:hypothetical protein ACTHGU_01770 [Chitinophagaceae bacterium MMS25-I14]